MPIKKKLSKEAVALERTSTSPRQGIRQFATDLGIPYLVHFTKVANLPSIIRFGLYPRDRVKETGVDPNINDELRLDGRLKGTSISIAFPNSKMFYKYRMEDSSVNWAVLLLSNSVLWRKECAFCRHNAADTRISGQSQESLATEAAFRGLFDEIDDGESRQEQNLKPYDPTDVQAEVMVLDVVEPEYILDIAFDSRPVREAHAHLLTAGQKGRVDPKDRGLFASRSYARKQWEV